MLLSERDIIRLGRDIIRLDSCATANPLNLSSRLPHLCADYDTSSLDVRAAGDLVPQRPARLALLGNATFAEDPAKWKNYVRDNNMLSGTSVRGGARTVVRSAHRRKMRTGFGCPEDSPRTFLVRRTALGPEDSPRIGAAAFVPVRVRTRARIGTRQCGWQGPFGPGWGKPR